MIDTKAMVIGQILKYENQTFKQRHIWEPLNISRQLCDSYIKKFFEKGLLTKQGSTYRITDKDGLLDEMLAGSERAKINLPSCSLLDSITFQGVTDIIDYTTCLRATNNSLAPTMTRILNEELDDLIASAREAKKYLNSKRPTQKYARNKVQADEFPEVIWKVFEKQLSFYVNHDEFVETLKERHEELS